MNRIVRAGLVCIACVAAVIPLKAQEITEESRNLFSTRPLKSKVPLSTGSQVIIKSATTLRGHLTITTSTDQLAMIGYTKKAKARNRSSAIDFIDQIAVDLVKIPGGVRLELRAPNPAPWSDKEFGSVEVQLMIPEQCHVDIDASFFDIVAEGPFAEFIVPSSLGRLEVANVTEELVLVTSNQRVSVEDISGRIDVSTSNSPLIAQKVACRGGQGMFRNEGSEIKISEVSGDINVKNSYGRIEIDAFAATGEKSYIRSNYGPIEVNVTGVAAGQLIVTNRYEDIEISLPNNVSAEFSLAVEEEGKIEVYNFPFKPDLVRRNRLSLISGDGEALISGSVRGKGNLYVRGYDVED
ncbi:MAG: hypothetical protein JSU74_03545 [Candidatus Zixiibacteriota bacterium]|nr:MAG: hypothetical protein JSU74_03545 [candidate division Zixibacteria bacterium]